MFSPDSTTSPTPTPLSQFPEPQLSEPQPLEPQPLAPTSADTSRWGLRNAHDPTVVQCSDGTFVMFSTDAWSGGTPQAGVHMRSSTDLINWEWAGTAFADVPAEAHAHTGARGLWAPEVVRWPTADGSELWRMFYSASSFGSRTSAIGLASAPDPRGPWEPGQIVVKTVHETSPHNAIDAAVTWDAEGRPWLTYGSFFAGIHTLELDPVTALPVNNDSAGTLIANRPQSADGAIEGAFIVNRTGEPVPAATDAEEREDYVAFLSYDSLVNEYSIRTARAERMTGPYADADGAPAISADTQAEPNHNGTVLLAGHHFAGQHALIAPGHNSVLHSADADFLVHHVRFGATPHEHSAQVRRLFWLDSGWPAASPLPYHGEPDAYSQALADPAYAGTWRVVDFRNTPAMIRVDMPDGVPDRLAPCTASEDLWCSGDLAELGIVEAAIFQVYVPTGEGHHQTLGFSGYARDLQADNRLTAVFGYLAVADLAQANRADYTPSHASHQTSERTPDHSINHPEAS